jgi:hypothetical protein
VFRRQAAHNKPLAKTDNQNIIQRWPQVLPGRQTALLTISANPFSWTMRTLRQSRLRPGNQDRPAWRLLRSLRTVSTGRGHLLYVHESTLYAVAFDPSALETSGTAVPLLTEVEGNAVDGNGQFDMSMNGTLVYVSGKSTVSSSYPISWLATRERSIRWWPTWSLRCSALFAGW